MSVPRVGIGGPVGSGKTALMLQLCCRLRERYEIAAVTNDIYCREDADFLVRHSALAPERIVGVETGGCPHTAIREDASINLAAVADMRARFPDLDPNAVRPGGLTALRRPIWVVVGASGQEGVRPARALSCSQPHGDLSQPGV